MKRFLAIGMAALLAGVTAPAEAVAFTSADVPKTINDNDPSGFSSTLLVNGLTGAITDVNLIFNSLTHTSVADLHIELRSPDGAQKALVFAFTESGILTDLGTPDNFINTVFDDQAATNLSVGDAPFSGAFNINHPSVGNDPLSFFNGRLASGTWTLFVSDRADGDVGTLNNWSLDIITDGVTGAVPEPTTWAMMITGFGLVGGALRRRRNVSTTVKFA